MNVQSSRRKWNRVAILAHLVFIATSLCGLRADIELGVLQGTLDHAPALKEAGIGTVVLDLSWQRFEPKLDTRDAAYVAELRKTLSSFQQLGITVILDLGMQYPPNWLFALPDSRYRNQYGQRFEDHSPGMNVPNAVFNQQIRECQADYIESVFRELGKDFLAVRLGGGWYGELNYPPPAYAGKKNAYWAFDDIAQGTRRGLPPGIPVCPVPGWKPGDGDPVAAECFLEWYLNALQNYHDWQIRTVREFYPGSLMMLYPSWGIRPGQREAAVANALSDDTPAERNGEIQRGFDFERFIRGIRDDAVIVHTTWLDSDPAFGDDDSPHPEQWSPIHFLASLASRHEPALPISGENTGGGGDETMALCAARMARYHGRLFLWAFAGDLMDGHSPGPKALKAHFQSAASALSP